MTNMQHAELLRDVARYYSEKLSAHGQTPQGVDWNGEGGQQLRFEQLTKLITPTTQTYRINDIGCGYGALVDFLRDRFPRFSYVGTDISPDMVQAARLRYKDVPGVQFLEAGAPAAPADFGIASGIFNLRQGRSDKDWLDYIKSTLDVIDDTSEQGFSFNCLTSYSDAEKMRPDILYYADPAELFDHCKRNYSRNVALLHDYDLYEFTILVRKGG